MALSGGNTPGRLYNCLAHSPFSTRMPWRRTHLFWGDERCVPPNHPDSNYSMAFQTMISKVPLPAENIHRIPAETRPHESAAETYEQILREFFIYSKKTEPFFSSPVKREKIPSFDLILLGMGKDGHTASLFPGDPVLGEEKRWVAAVCAPGDFSPRERITLTLPLINRASCVLFLISGSDKKKVLEAVLNGTEDACRLYPAARVRPAGRLIWFVSSRNTDNLRWTRF